MLKRHDSKTDEVKKLQQALLDLGYPLPRWGADGDLGDESLAAVGMFLRDHQEKDTNTTEVSDEELALIYRVLASAQEPNDIGLADGKFHDLRSVASQKHDYGQRPWSKVTGICLHQTACNLGEKPKRWETVGCHVGITRTGQVIWLHDFDRLIVHGNGWNAQTVGIEIDGLYAGIEGDIKTVWDDPSTPYREQPKQITPELVDAALKACRWISREIARHGGKLKVVVAHRQSSGTRRNDPGSAIWQAIALPLHKELGVTDGGKGFRIGEGYPIPEAWDPAHTGVKY